MLTHAQREAYNRWYASHREEWLAVRRARYAANPKPHRERQKLYAKQNPDKILAKYERFQSANPDYSRWHYHSTPQRKIGHILRKALFSALKHHDSGRDWYPNSKLGPLIGCSKPDLIAHIEGQFLPGMFWTNHGRGGWEVDHIIPCNAFDLTDPAQQYTCFHYTNLRPLWRADNLGRPKKED